MLIGGVLFGLIAGLLAGGRVDNLVRVTLRLKPLLLAAVVIRLGTEFLIGRGVGWADEARLPLFGAAFGLLLIAIWQNRGAPGFRLAFVGILGNTIAIVINGGWMPIWEPSLAAAGFSPDEVQGVFHTILPPALDLSFFVHAGPLGDVIPIPFALVRNVASIGDLFLTAGLGFFLFATVHGPAAEAARSESIGRATALPGRRLVGLGGVGLAAGLAEASMLERPLLLGSAGQGLAEPSLLPLPFSIRTAQLEREAAAERAAHPIAERARRLAYVRLALNESFSALWVGQLISLFGDRIHQVAIAFLVLGATNSPLAVGLVFLAATIPNLILGPVAGTLVDRWDHRQVMVASDLIRGGLVLILPVAAATNLILVYPLVFLITSVSLFFRPARTAMIPRLVRDDELLTANSATWLGETMADIVGYPLAGLFVAFLGSALPLAFWIDGATYVASAILIASIAVPAMAGPSEEGARGSGFFSELRAGWRFLRRDTVLLANTLQGAAGQFTAGVTLALTPIYARDVIASVFDPTARYAFLETGLGVGNLAGGLVIGLIGARLGKGRMIIVGYTIGGACTAALALVGSLETALGLMLGIGVANMVYIIPSQTLFQERVPSDLIGRVVGFRFAVVFGSLTLAMAVSGLLAEAVGPGPVIGMFGIVSMLAGLGGLLVPALRDA